MKLHQLRKHYLEMSDDEKVAFIRMYREQRGNAIMAGASYKQVLSRSAKQPKEDPLKGLNEEERALLKQLGITPAQVRTLRTQNTA